MADLKLLARSIEMAKRTARPPRTKPPKGTWLGRACSSALGGMAGIYAFATPDNLSWLTSHGGKVFSGAAVLLAIANFIHSFRAEKK